MEKGKTYFYKYNGYLRSGVFLRSTNAWNIFLRDGQEDWLKSYAPVYESEQHHEAISAIADGIKKDTRIPSVIAFPNRF